MRTQPNNVQFSVDPYTGGFNFHATDLIIPAPGIPVLIERFHDSLASFSPNSGWRFNFDESIRYEPLDESITVNSPNGGKERFVKNPNETYSSTTPGSLNTFKDNKDGSFTLTFKDKISHLFYAPDSEDSNYGKLYKIKDTHNNTITFYWAKFGSQVKITKIRDSIGRILNIEYVSTPDGRDLMYIKDWSGRKLTYTTISGWLTLFEDFEGNVTTYKPSAENRVLRTECREPSTENRVPRIRFTLRHIHQDFEYCL